jgi:hypothetical protein
MRSSPQIWLFFVVSLGAAGCTQPPDQGSGGAPMERVETAESQVSPSCSYCLQACRLSLRSCRYMVDGGYLRCEIDRGGCADRCRQVCR